MLKYYVLYISRSVIRHNATWSRGSVVSDTCYYGYGILEAYLFNIGEHVFIAGLNSSPRAYPVVSLSIILDVGLF